MARAHIDIELRWADQDAYGHINNVAYARYLEEARVRVFFTASGREKTGMEGHFRDDEPDGRKMLVASQQIEFLETLEYSPHPISVEMWVARLGGSSLDLHFEVLDGEALAAGDRRVVVRAVMTAVIVGGTDMRPVRHTPEARASVERWMDEPVKMRR